MGEVEKIRFAENLERFIEKAVAKFVLESPANRRKADKGKYMTANEAMDLLLEIEKDKPKKILEKSDVIVCCRMGSPNQLIKYGPIGILRKSDFGFPFHILIIPGKLHEMEEKFLSQFK